MCIGACSRARTMCIEKTRIIKPHTSQSSSGIPDKKYSGGGGSYYTRDRAQRASRERDGGESELGEEGGSPDEGSNRS